MSAFGSGSNSNGQYWFGQYGFLYKKNLGVGGRRSTKFNPGGNITCNGPTYLYNKFTPGGGGVGASSTSNRRAKNRLATVHKCFPCYTTLGQYSNNPNGFIPCPAPIQVACNTLVPGDAPANMDTTGLTNITSLNNVCDPSYATIPLNFDYYFLGSNCGNGPNTFFGWDTIRFLIFGPSINIDPAGFIVLGTPQPPPYPPPYPKNNQFWYSGTMTNGSTKYIRLLYFGQNLCADEGVNIEYDITLARDKCNQYVEIRTQQVPSNIGLWDIFSLSSGPLGVCGDFDTTGGPQPGGSYVFRSDLLGNNWTFLRNYYLNL
jgi:hypothetical protein